METRKIQLTGGSSYTVSLPKEWVTEHTIDQGSEIYLHPHTDGSIAIRATPKETQLSTVETRKIQRVGESTYAISLPKDWAEQHDLEKGTRVYLHYSSDGSLVVQGSTTQSEGVHTHIEVEVDELDERALRRAVYASYAAGYDIIRLVSASGFDTHQTNVITDTVRKLMGTEIVEEKHAEFILKDLLNTAEVSIPQSIVQLRFIALSMYRDAVQAVRENDTTRAERIFSRDDEVDRLFGMISRYFQRVLTNLEEVDQLGIDRSTLFAYYMTAHQLERVADHAETLAVITLDTKPETELSSTASMDSLAEQATEIVDQAIDALLEGTVIDAYKALDRYDELLEEIKTARQELSKADTADTDTAILESLCGTAECGANVAKMKLQTAARHQNL